MAQRPDASNQSRWLDLVQRWLRSHAALARLGQLSTVESEARERIAEGKLEGPAADAVRLALRQPAAVDHAPHVFTGRIHTMQRIVSSANI
jgi:hypothetical protein